MHAVILAAGMGTRLGGDGPKPLTELAPGRSLLSNQVDLLGECLGRENIILVLGDQKQEIINQFSDLRSVCNDRYAQTNTAKSLLCGIEKIEGDVLWTNADVYFEKDALERLIQIHPDHSRCLVNTMSTAEEEIKYSLRSDGSIEELSKQVTDAEGESLGLHIVLSGDLPELRAGLEQAHDDDYFEKALETSCLAGRMRIMPIDIGDCYCREVDFPEDLQAVRDYLKNREP